MPRIYHNRFTRAINDKCSAGTEREAVAPRLLPKPHEAEATRSLPLPVPHQSWKYGQGEYDEKEKKLKNFTEHKFFAAGSWRLNANELDPPRQTAFINREGGVPSGKANSAIRRWTASFDGKVTISGQLIHNLEQSCVTCDGVEAVIVSSRSGSAGNWSAYLSQAETAATVEVKTGDTIDFIVLNKKNTSGDDFKWYVNIRREGSAAYWDSIRDFYSPLAQPMNAWERYVQALIAAVEFSMID